MNSQNTLYIAEPMFSEKLQRFDSEAGFPPIKKIGITTGHPERRERELLGTISPVKVSIVKAWTEVDARKVESMLHTILDNTRLDGEYFWDGNETLLDAVSDFIATYHPEAEEIAVSDDSDVAAATEAAMKRNSQRIYAEVVPELESLSIPHHITKNGKGVRFKLGEYSFHLSGRTGGRYTLTISSKTQSTDQALSDFPDSQELSPNSSEDSNRKARIPMSTLEVIIHSISNFLSSRVECV
ncbi:GIY-YIG nuclease family protein [Pseudoteredinibacter isoporae]|uniref:GIY-YIG nuclease family protein n=1 Tax=Pseudoteredinibacter isoporae TaxID=570281 RepID=UPI003103AAFA